MKTQILSIATISLIAIACNNHSKQCDNTSNTNPATVENIQYVIVAEEQSSANNKAYAQKAKEENHKNVASMFTAKAKADSIRAEKHKATLAAITDTNKLAQRPAPKKIQPKTTADNLKQSINDDEYQVTIVYPNYIEQAIMAGDSLTITTLQWAADGRKNDQQYGLAVLETVSKNGNDMAVSDTWFVCPVCGSISDSTHKAGTAGCNSCGVAEEDFIVVNN